jgi:hypothetical protein
MQIFGCRRVKVPEDWDDQLPGDAALKLAGADEPSIALRDRAEADRAGLDCSNSRPILFCKKAADARQYLMERGAVPGPILDGSVAYFEVLDPEGNIIEVCEEP